MNERIEKLSGGSYGEWVNGLGQKKKIDFTLSMQEAWKVIEDFRERQKEWKKRIEMKEIEREINENVQKHIDENREKDIFSQYFDDMTKYQRAVNKIRSKMLHILNNKGEKKVLKIILKNIETGWYHCYDVTKENESQCKNLKVGDTVYYCSMLKTEKCKVEKIVNTELRKGESKGAVFSEFANMPSNFVPYPYQWKPFWQGIIKNNPYMCSFPRRAMKTTLTKKYLDDCRQIRLEHKEVEKYNEKPYFLARLDTIKGTPDGKENLEKMMFPCYVIWKNTRLDTDHLGQLVTGFPHNVLEYQLIDLGRQVPVDECCTVDRNVDLKELMDRWHIEIVKGEAQLQKVGKVNV